MEEIRETHPEFFEYVRKDPIFEIYDGLDPRDLEVRSEDIKMYPGSPRGMSPQDDPKAFAEWLPDNIPPAYQLILNRIDNMIEIQEQKMKEEKEILNRKETIFQHTKKKPEIETSKPEEEQVEEEIVNHLETEIVNYTGQYWEFYLEGMGEEILDNEEDRSRAHHTMEKSNYINLPIFPVGQPNDYENRLAFLKNWSSFRDPLK